MVHGFAMRYSQLQYIQFIVKEIITIFDIGIFAQVNITNPTTWLVEFDALRMLYSPAGEYNKTEIEKMAASHFVEVYW